MLTFPRISDSLRAFYILPRDRIRIHSQKEAAMHAMLKMLVIINTGIFCIVCIADSF